MAANTPIQAFVCYSRRDARWVVDDRASRPGYGIVPWLARQLASEETRSLLGNTVELWWDKRLDESPKAFKNEIRARIENSQVAFLLLSQEFLASDFIRDHEVRLIREREQTGEMFYIPILVGEISRVNSEIQDWIFRVNVIPRGNDGTEMPLICAADPTEWDRVKIHLLNSIRARIRNGMSTVSASRAALAPADHTDGLPPPSHHEPETRAAAVPDRKPTPRSREWLVARKLSIVAGVALLAVAGVRWALPGRTHQPSTGVVTPRGAGQEASAIPVAVEPPQSHESPHDDSRPAADPSRNHAQASPSQRRSQTPATVSGEYALRSHKVDIYYDVGNRHDERLAAAIAEALRKADACREVALAPRESSITAHKGNEVRYDGGTEVDAGRELLELLRGEFRNEVFNSRLTLTQTPGVVSVFIFQNAADWDPRDIKDAAGAVDAGVVDRPDK